jgi:hypothetical protein
MMMIVAGQRSSDQRTGVAHSPPERPKPAAGMSSALARTPVLKPVQNLNVGIIDAASGELLRELAVNPGRDYQPPANPRPSKRNDPEPDQGFRVSPMS